MTQAWFKSGIALAVVLFGCSATTAAAAPPDPAADQVLVRFRADAGQAEREAARRDAGTSFEQSLALPGLQLLDLRPGVSAGEAVELLERSDDVLYAEPNVSRTAAAQPSDPYFSSQWALRVIGMPAAWDRSTGDPAVTVGVVDSGIDYGHPDLSRNVARNDGESGDGRESNGRDDDADGLVDNWRGWDWVEWDNDPADLNGHGTHVSGVIGARGNDFRGVAGVGWQVKLMPLRVLDAKNTGRISDVVAAFGYAASKNLPIVNASLGGPDFSQAEYDAIAAAPGTLFVVAAGNDGRNGDVTPSYPCGHRLPNVICVTASDQNDALAGFANYGSGSVDLAAPGVDVMSTLPRSRWGSMSGTSSAAPHVAGTAALIRSLRPQASVPAMRDALLGGVDRRSSLEGRTATGGRLNAERSLATATTQFPLSPADRAAREPATPATAPDVAPPALATAFAPRSSLRRVLRRGLRVRTGCSEACSLRLRLTVTRAGVARRKLAAPSVRVGRGRSRLDSPGSTVVRVRFSPRARRLLQRVRPHLLTLTVRATDDAGNRASVRRPLRLRRARARQ